MNGYPEQPGWRGNATGETSREAAQAVRPTATYMIDRLAKLLEIGPASPEQLQAMLAERGEQALLTTIRARVCQLRALGQVVDSGLRGKGESQRVNVIRWRLSTPDERAAFAATKAAERGERGAP